jgi:hypothetical protein
MTGHAIAATSPLNDGRRENHAQGAPYIQMNGERQFNISFVYQLKGNELSC